MVSLNHMDFVEELYKSGLLGQIDEMAGDQTYVQISVQPDLLKRLAVHATESDITIETLIVEILENDESLKR
jgi:hypothetical protein